MHEQRIGAVGGLWFAILSVASGVTLPKPPAADASAATIRDYLTEHHSRLQAASVMSALATLGLLVLVVSLRQRLAVDPIAARLTLAGGTLIATVALLGSMLQAAIAQVGGRLSGDSVVLSFAVLRAVFYIAPAFAVTMLVLGVARGAAKAALPAWIGAFALLITAVGIAGGVGQLTSTSSAVSALGFIGFLLTVVWVAATSVVLLRLDAPAAKVAAHAPAQ